MGNIRVNNYFGGRNLQILFRLFQLLILLPAQILPVSSERSARQAVPKFLPTPTNVTVHKGELAVLRCHIRNLGPKLVVWRRSQDESPLTIDKMTFSPEQEISVNYKKISETDSTWDLLIKNVQSSHAGVYACQISSKELYSHHVTLHVIDEPPDWQPELIVKGTEYVEQFNDIHLTCNATGVERAPDDIDWFFQGNRIHTSNPKWQNRIQVLKKKPIPGRSIISELIIQGSTTKDQGNYVCRSSDLNFRSVQVHVLNADKPPIKQRGLERSAHNSDHPSSAPHLTSFHKFVILLVIILAFR
ncbi:hypothetical protein CHS0354_027596 [Potamilus streckersoni]|uniref:Ig-like domain-containing protein n=1 Tax=Potamilus streckersoni TaxID=2493646 RepID=A0AAE0S4A2_9BIVA|nr:hypothetical protein CHS0354_027596 [Potamilus streckersoni]